MKQRFITISLLIIALIFYLLGYSGAGWAMVLLGFAFEIWFWFRIF